MTERRLKAVLAARCFVGAGEAERIYRECLCPLGPPWRLSIDPSSELVVTGLFVGRFDLLDERQEFKPLESPGRFPQSGVGADAFWRHGLGLPLHGPELQRGSVVAVDLYNPSACAQVVWVSVWGTLS